MTVLLQYVVRLQPETRMLLSKKIFCSTYPENIFVTLLSNWANQLQFLSENFHPRVKQFHYSTLAAKIRNMNVIFILSCEIHSFNLICDEKFLIILELRLADKHSIYLTFRIR
jgi:hypothetical protein